ncbi:MAG: bifunctional (p)ppGpp synthetase/guanosine-3',5'-bis(diphosphate) 3'-pyrophosphohydrolase [Magnetococcales bacterium]|nr:bifunctional (p)ppGpp synthetase/guanosine-3',5'-bis(diphosphate) 3'-pyrophosphohydrolase [Magnetococcales bacterium]
MPTLLEKAIRLALDAHQGQTDKAGAPYLLHPLRMMLRMETEEERIVAVLHDVVEDSETSFEDLRRLGCSKTIVDAVDALTHRYGEAYEEYLVRAGANPLARRVKRADLEDNMDLRRIDNPTDADFQRLLRYRRAWSLLGEAGTPDDD